MYKYLLLAGIGCLLSACQLQTQKSAYSLVQVKKYATKATSSTKNQKDSIPVQQHVGCDDFLKTEKLHIDFVHYQGCQLTVFQNKPALVAIYKVTGKNVYQVQHALQKHTDMPSLYKDCCMWESFDPTTERNFGHLHTTQKSYFINMQSNEVSLGWGQATLASDVAQFDLSVISHINSAESNHPVIPKK